MQKDAAKRLPDCYVFGENLGKDFHVGPVNEIPIA